MGIMLGLLNFKSTLCFDSVSRPRLDKVLGQVQRPKQHRLESGRLVNNTVQRPLAFIKSLFICPQRAAVTSANIGVPNLVAPSFMVSTESINLVTGPHQLVLIL